MGVKYYAQMVSFYSAVLPGLGQAYNGKYWKIPIIYAGAAVIGYYYVYNNNKYIEYKENYLKVKANDPNNPPDIKFKNASPERILYYMNYWERNRDMLLMGMIALYIANIVDATVDAYLFDYDVSQNLAFNIKPSLLNNCNHFSVGIKCSFRF